MKNNRPETTLFMLVSVDGKISTGSGEKRDFDKDLPKVPGLAEGLHQYYDLEKQTDLYSLNTGRVFEKIGINEGKLFQDDLPVHFVVIDNQPHLTTNGIRHLIEKSAGLIIVTTNNNHPAFRADINTDKLQLKHYDHEIDFVDLFDWLADQGVKHLTIQSGGTLNTELVRKGLVDHLSIVVVPVLVGGKDTPTLLDGKSLASDLELIQMKTLVLSNVRQLENSYIHLEYDLVNKGQ